MSILVDPRSTTICHTSSAIHTLGFSPRILLTHGAQRSALLDTETIQRYLGLMEDEHKDEEQVEEDFT